MTSHPPARSTAIVDVTIVDVETGKVVPGQTVVIADERIERIGPAASVSIPEQAQTIDGRGLYLMPGLVDAHVHYLDAPIFGRLMLANGVVLVRDMGMPTEFILGVRDALNRGDTLGPEMVAAGAMLDGDPPVIPLIALGVKTPEEGRAAVRGHAQAGVDFIKVYSALDKDVFLAILDEAQKHGLKVAGHVPETLYIEDAAAAGLQCSEHFFGLEKVIAKLLGAPINLSFTGLPDASYLQRVAEVNAEELQGVYERIRASGMTICPTVVTFKVGTEYSLFKSERFPRSEYLSPTVVNIWKMQWSQQDDLPDFVWRNWAQMVGGLHRSGVALVVGTDLMVPGVFPGDAVHEEMAIWQEAGIPPADVLRAATCVPARLAGLGERLGSIGEGKTASLVLVRANPLDDIRNARAIEGVFLRGRHFSRTDLDRLLTEARELARPPAP